MIRVTGQPALLLYNRALLTGVMKKEITTVEEIYMKDRANGNTHLKEVETMVLGSTGDMTTLPKSEISISKNKTFSNISGYPPSS